ncbi:hypothetical protein BP5796_13146 [Coleophoma crateriformis]|uniref:Uncharacterized protein n=1 Tax=Coleophoma crateriformis TaxID=565419 RepID=A0A3D8Q3P9_9HELO|nr:hypothetical protein BP5796_13146 [Coleophoma crateriformis]
MLNAHDNRPSDVFADINYFAADGQVREVASWRKRYLGIGDEHTRKMRVHDIRPFADHFTLDKNGFQFTNLAPKNRDTNDEALIKREYYKEVEELVKNMTGADVVYVFNHAIRRASTNIIQGVPDEKGQVPSGHPHVDYCGVPELMEGTKKELSLPEEIKRLFASSLRFSFINAWRPIQTVERDPLALADATTVPDSDYLVRARTFPSGINAGNYIMSHGSQEQEHQWYYMSEMQPNELVVFKGYDTKQDLPGWRCPHTAITLPDTESLPSRQSIECRAACFWN